MIAFRVDANATIATGHLMRCLTIAIECRKRGEECIFFLADENGVSRVKQLRFPYVVLNTKWDELEEELPLFRKELEKMEVELLVVDSYQITGFYLEQLQHIVPVFFIDDFAEKKYVVAGILHYIQWPDENCIEEQYQGTTVKLLSGMKYAPLREEFRLQKKYDRGHRILLTTGGTDAYHLSKQILLACIINEELNKYQYDVIVGQLNLHEKELQDLLVQYPQIHLHKNINNMSDYMRECEFAISAGGTTLLELCACKIPTVCFSVADNQKNFAKKMGIYNIMLYAGDVRENKNLRETIVKCLLQYLRDSDLKQQRISAMGKLVDEYGTVRIVDELQALKRKSGSI